MKANAQTFKVAVIDIQIPFCRIATKTFVNSRLLL